MSKVTRSGRVTIPKEIREKLGIRPGDEITFTETEAGIVIRKEVPEDRFEKWRGVADADESVEERMAAPGPPGGVVTTTLFGAYDTDPQRTSSS